MRLTIGKKLGLFSALGIVLAGGMVANQWLAGMRIAGMDDVVEREQTILDGVQGARTSFYRMQVALSDLLVANTAEEATKIVAGLKEVGTSGRAELETPIKLAFKPETLRKLQAGLASFMDVALKYPSVIRFAGGRAVIDERLTAPLDVERLAIRTDFMATVSEGFANVKRFTDEARLARSAASEQANRFALVVGLVVMLTLLGSALFSALSVARPIRRMTAAMGRLAAGETELEIPGRGRGDEIGAMAGTVEVFRDNLLRTRALEAETAQARLSAEEQRKLGMRQLADDFERAVGGIVDGVSAAATQMQATARGMTTIATQTASQTTTVAAAAEEASSNVNTVAAAAEELGVSVQEIGRQVTGSAQIAQLAAQEAGTTADLVRELSEAANRIGDVVGMISTIAAQTNLLALNATIEAARAGEAGRGFAVVAAEVKELASQTSRATDEISGQVGRIQGSTSQAVTAIGSIATRIGEINAVATSIAAAVEEQGAATSEIVRNVSQAAQGTGEVTGSIAAVAGAAEETGAAAAQVLSSAGELSRQAEHLTGEMGRFLATVRAA